MTTRWITLLLAFAFLAAPALAGDKMDIRLVAILPGVPADSTGVDDIVGLLKKNLGENRYDLAGQDSISLPANQTKVSLAHVILLCSGSQKNLQISVSTRTSKGKSLIDTNVSLEDGKPFLLGGTGKKTKFVLVFVTK